MCPTSCHECPLLLLHRYIIKLKPGTSFAAVNMICLELAGQIAEPTRFNGLCNTPLNTVSAVGSLWAAACHMLPPRNMLGSAMPRALILTAPVV